MNSEAISIEEVERHCLASMFLANVDVIQCQTEGLVPTHFKNAYHGEIFRACVEAAKLNGPEIPFEVIYGKSLAGLLPFNASDISMIAAVESTSINRPHYVARIIAAAKQRKLSAHLQNALSSAGQDSDSWAETWDSVAPDLAAIGEIHAAKPLVSFAEMVDRYTDEQRFPEKMKRISLGIPAWDRAAGQVKQHELVTIAARPGTGKTALALQMASYVAFKLRHTVVFFSLEMAGTELVDRLVKNRAGRDGVGDHLHEVNRRVKEANEVRDLKTLIVYDETNLTIDDIEARCRLLAVAPGGLALVVIDYMQLIMITPESKRLPREQQVAEISRRLKQLPKSIGAPVVNLAQFNRDSEKDNRPPRMSDIRESGSIEQDSDRLWFLYKPIQKDGEPMRDESADIVDVCLLQEKCRGGKPGIVMTLQFNRPIYRLTPQLG